MKIIDIAREKISVDFDKNKNLVLKSIIVYANNKKREEKTVLTKAQVNELLKAKQREVFMHLLTKKFDVVAKLKRDAQAKKANLCKNTAYCVIADNVASFLKHDSVKYINANANKKTAKKAVKKTAKKAVKKTAKKAVKKTAKK